jgi:hypothetical protein
MSLHSYVSVHLFVQIGMASDLRLKYKTTDLQIILQHLIYFNSTLYLHLSVFRPSIELGVEGCIVLRIPPVLSGEYSPL